MSDEEGIEDLGVFPITLEYANEPKSFADIDELREFVTEERNSISSHIKSIRNSLLQQGVDIKAPMASFDYLDSRLDDLLDAALRKPEEVPELLRSLNDFLAEDRLESFDSSAMTFILQDLSAEFGSRAAFFVLCFYYQLPCQPANTTDILAILKSRDALGSSREVDTTLGDAFVDSKIEGLNRFKNMVNRLGRAANEAASIKSDIESAHASQKEEFGTLVTDSTARLDDLERAYKEAVALKAPVDYWTKKSNEHKGQREAFGYIACGWSCLSLMTFYLIVRELLGNSSITSVELWKLGITAGIATLLIWVLRICIRMYISHYHLEQDANERVTMVQTYLALSTSEETESIDMQMLLVAIFRHSTTGMVADDGPVTAIDAVTSMFSQSK